MTTRSSQREQGGLFDYIIGIEGGGQIRRAKMFSAAGAGHRNGLRSWIPSTVCTGWINKPDLSQRLQYDDGQSRISGDAVPPRSEPLH